MSEAVCLRLIERLGLRDDDAARSNLERAQRVRRRTLGLDERAYGTLLAHTVGEFNQLVDEAVVPETWFFRDPESFDALRQLACTKASFRVLCVPCCSGEEAYSVAIALAQAGLPCDAIEVVACDVSAPLLKRARSGSYAERSFRRPLVECVSPYLRMAGPARLEVIPALRARVHFSQANVTAPHWQPSGQFDAIFCRNLLIYLADGQRKELLGQLAKMLRPAGRLFVGTGEGQAALSAGFSFVTDRASAGLQVATARHRPSIRTWSAPASRPQPRAPEPIPARSVTSPAGAAKLAEAARLADLGELQEAARLCEEHLAEGGGKAETLFLLAVVHCGLDLFESALNCLTRALSHDANHAEALQLMAVLHRGGPFK